MKIDSLIAELQKIKKEHGENIVFRFGLDSDGSDGSDGSDEINESDKFNGYMNFYSDIEFTKDGAFVRQGFWE
jgi:hypothetical protein